MRSSNKKDIARVLLILYFTISIIEITAEFFNDTTFIWIFKPLLMPILIGYYYYISKIKSLKYIIALIFCWCANILFIQNELNYIVIGSIFFLLYRIIVINLILELEKRPIKIPLLIGIIPFFFIYASICFITFQELGSNIYLFLIHGVFIIFLGGFSLGNYITYPTKINLILLISTLLFAFTQFVFVIKIYSDYDNTLHALAMMLFLTAQFLLTKFVYLKEKSKPKYAFVTNINEL